MPGQLAWNQVATPDLSTALAGIQGFGRDFRGAADTASTALGAFNQYQQDLTSKAFLQHLQTYASPDALKAAMADGSLYSGYSPSNLNTSAIEQAGKQPGVLLNNAMDQLKLNEGNRDFSQRQAQDAQAPQVAALLAAAQQHDWTTANKLYQGIDFSKTGANFANNLNTDAQGADTTQISNNAKSFELANTQRDDKINSQAADIWQKLLLASGGRPDDIAARIPGAIPADDPNAGRIGLRLHDLLNQAAQSGGLRGGMGGAPGGGGSGGGLDGVGPQATAPGGANAPGNVFDISVGGGKFGSAPITGMTVGQAVDYGKNTLIPNTIKAGIGRDANGKVVGSSAVGGYQITGSTLQQYAPKALGADWANKPMTPENQDAIARAVFEDRKNGDLASTWTSLKDHTPGAYKNMTWEQIRPQILAGESGGGAPDISRLLNQSVLSGQAAANQESQQNAFSISSDIQSALGDKTNITDVAKSLAKDLPGAPSGNLERILQQIQDKAKNDYGVNLSAAAAATILKNSTKSANAWDKGWQHGLLGLGIGGNLDDQDIGSGLHTDWKAVGDKISQIKDGTVQTQSALNANLQQKQGVKAAAELMMNQAYARYIQAQRDKINIPGYDPDGSQLERYKQAYVTAAANLTGATQALDGATQDAFKPPVKPTGNPNQRVSSTPGKFDLGALLKEAAGTW